MEKLTGLKKKIQKMGVNINWKQEGTKLSFKYKDVNIYFMMPEDWKLEDTHKDLLKIAEWLLISPWYPQHLKGYKFTRNPGKNKALAFSGGVDSTAVMLLMNKKTPLVYYERHGVTDGVLNQDNAYRFLEKLEEEGRNVIRIKSNSERVRVQHKLQLGYSTGLSMGVPLVLLADYLGLGYITYGMIFDSTYMPYGKFRPLTKEFYERQNMFEDAGIQLYFPLLGASEVITSRIVGNSKYKDYAQSCLRGSMGEGCNDCYKCFRKSLLGGKVPRLNKAIESLINKNPPKMAPSLIYGVKKMEMDVPSLDIFMDRNVEIFEHLYPVYLDLYDMTTTGYLAGKLVSMGIEPMTSEEIGELMNMSFIREETG